MTDQCTRCRRFVEGVCTERYAPMFKGKCTKFDKREEPEPGDDGQVLLFHEEEIK